MIRAENVSPVTPGARVRNVSTRRAPPETCSGKSAKVCGSRTTPRSPLSSVTGAIFASTFIVSETLPTAICRLSVVLRPTATSTRSASLVPKPLFSAFTEYVPGGRLSALKIPSCSGGECLDRPGLSIRYSDVHVTQRSTRWIHDRSVNGSVRGALCPGSLLGAEKQRKKSEDWQQLYKTTKPSHAVLHSSSSAI